MAGLIVFSILMAALSGDTCLAGTFTLSPDLYHANPTYPQGKYATNMRYVMAAALFDRDLADTFTLSPDLQTAPSHKRHATKMRYVQEMPQCAARPCGTFM